MERINCHEIVRAVSGKAYFKNDFYIDNISTNSKEIKENTLFIPLIGDKFDAHDFISDVIKSNCTCIISQKEINADNYILVEDTKKALMDLAEYYRSLFDIPFIAITGSVGKTTTKDIVHKVLSQKYVCLKTEGNFNNEIGVPKTIFNLTNNTEVAVIEMGMSDFGEIHNLSKIVKPDLCLITKIGLGHTENLKNKEGVLKAKLEIIDFMKENGKLILNFDDGLLSAYNNSDINIIGVGENNKSDLLINSYIEKGLDGLSFNCSYEDENFNIESSLLGKSLITNLAFGVITGVLLGLSAEEIKNGIKEVTPTKNRMEIIRTPNFNIVSDCYNANPTSMMSSLYFLSTCKDKKIAILGDMLELGKEEIFLHEEVGEYISSINIDILICFGLLSEYIYKKANVIKKYFCSTKDEIYGILDGIILDNSVILIKGSRGMKLEETIDYLKE